MKYACIALALASPAAAGPMDVHTSATNLFDRLPPVEVSDDLGEACGAGGNSNPFIGFCTTQNIIYVSPDFARRPTAAYEMAHVLGHAIQVRHGVADVALSAIRSRQSEESALRGMVTRQVECVAGVLMAFAGEAPAVLRGFGREPFTDAHWGREPLNIGPRVSIGLEARAQWYDTGYKAQDFTACTVDEMSSELIVQALR